MDIVVYIFEFKDAYQPHRTINSVHGRIVTVVQNLNQFERMLGFKKKLNSNHVLESNFLKVTFSSHFVLKR